MTPEMIRAAELIDGASAKDVFGDNPGGPKSGDFWDAAEVLATAILANRSDYGPDGEPLPVDPEFCRSLGMEVGEFAASTRKNGFRALHVTIDFPAGTLTVYVTKATQNELSGGMCLGKATRPQLRSLLNALGIGGAA